VDIFHTDARRHMGELGQPDVPVDWRSSDIAGVRHLLAHWAALVERVANCTKQRQAEEYQGRI
jgi:hypothetical protein